MSKKLLLITYYLSLITLILAPLSPIWAEAEFNFNYIISDEEFFDHESMDLDDIQRFLERQPGILATYETIDIDGVKRSAAEIIYRASQAYKISPKVILVKLQKEQSLIENPDPSDYNLRWAMGYARCDSCDPEDPRVAIFGGFATQVDRGAWRNLYYVDHPNEFNFQIGETYEIDVGHKDYPEGFLVTPVNQATVNLLNYTPHYHGNYNFWTIWNRFFVYNYPDGSLLQQEGEVGVWLIQNGLKRPFHSKTALISRYDINKIIVVSKSDLDKYEIGPAIKFPQYSLLQSPGGTVYLLVDDERRGISSYEVFRTIGFNPEEIDRVGWEDLADIPEGKAITMETVYPTGGLLQDKNTGGVYYVKEGVKHPIWDKIILKTNYSGRAIIPVSDEELEKYPTGDPAKFREGELITSDGYTSVFVVSNGQKRPIASFEVFQTLGYKWEQIIHTTDKILQIHPTGTVIDIIN